MHLFAHLVCRFLHHILALVLSSTVCLAAENDDGRHKEVTGPSKTRATSNSVGHQQARSPRRANRAARMSGATQTRAGGRDPAAVFRSARRLMRTRRLLLAALRVWELKNGYGS